MGELEETKLPEEASKQDKPVVSEQSSDEKSAEVGTSQESTLKTSGRKVRFAKLKQLFKSKKFRIAAPLVFLALVAIFLFVEPVKFGMLNLFIKGKVEFVIVDDSTLAPVEKAKITINGQTGETDKEGRATIGGLKFGNKDYKVEKENYTSVDSKAKIKPGTNFVGPVKLHSDGTPVSITAVNKLSKESVKNFKVAIDGSEISALASGTGTAILKVPSEKLGKVKITVSADGFNSTKTEIEVDPNKDNVLVAEIAPTGKHYFLSNRTGKISVFVANLDGGDQAEVVAGTGTEDTDTQLSIAPDNKHAVLISKRDNQKGPDGKVLPALFAVDLEQKTIKRIDEGAPTFSFVGWQDNARALYMVSYNDYNKADNTKLKRAEVNSSKLETLYTGKSFYDFNFYQEETNYVYFTQGDQSIELYGFISINLNNKEVKRVRNYPSYQLGHYKPFILTLNENESDKWYEFDMRSQQIKDAQKPNKPDLQITPAPAQKKIAWVETRDGKGVVIVADPGGENPTQVSKGTNASSIDGWISEDYIVYTVSSDSENAHYIVHLGSQNSTKISDVYRAQYYY